MDKKDMQLLIEQYYKFIGVPKRMQNKILNTLSYCKEIRDTAYPMKDSLVTELQLVEFTARKEKDLIYINGSLMLEDGDKHEVRTFEAYIIEDKEEGKTRKEKYTGTNYSRCNNDTRRNCSKKRRITRSKRRIKSIKIT